MPRLRQGEGQQADGQVLRTVSYTHDIVLLGTRTPTNVHFVRLQMSFYQKSVNKGPFAKRPVYKISFTKYPVYKNAQFISSFYE